MPPKKVARPAQENISLGPQVRDGMFVNVLNEYIPCLRNLFCLPPILQ
jgi:O-succinylbenzoate synthase